MHLNIYLITFLAIYSRYICKDFFGKGYFCEKNKWEYQRKINENIIKDEKDF